MRAWRILLLVAFALPAAADFLGVEDLPRQKKWPDPLRASDGSRIRREADWPAQRRWLTQMLLHYEYGVLPPTPASVSVEAQPAKEALGGVATLRRMSLKFGEEGAFAVAAGCYIPKAGSGPYPVVLALEPVWWPCLEEIARTVIARGYIFAGMEKETVDQDSADRSDGLHRAFPESECGTIAAWAWGLHRMVDYLYTEVAVDKRRIAVTGHSRGGKTALLAGALDARIALVVPHASGAGGAGAFRFQPKNCETLEAITDPDRFHYWFHPRLRAFAGKEDRLPFDQHFLKAVVAPRALLCMEALEDYWANPSGSQYTSQAAQPVFDLLGVPKHNAIYFRPGSHDMTLEDWQALLEFADHLFFEKGLTHDFYQRPFSSERVKRRW